MKPEQLYKLTRDEIPSELKKIGRHDLAAKFQGIRLIKTPARAQFAHVVFLGVLAHVQRAQLDVGPAVHTGRVESLLVSAIEGIQGIAGGSTCLN